MRRYKLLGKFLSLILRHDPARVGINLRSDGYVSIRLLAEKISAINRFSWVNEESILKAAKLDEKDRFEITEMSGELYIRARYGHNKNLGVKIDYPEVRKGEIKLLYHGTEEKNIQPILRNGILPMDRIYVHLSATIRDSVEVAKRRKGRPVVVVVDADRMIGDGYFIYRATKRVYLTKFVPPMYIIKTIKNIDRLL